MTIWLLRPVDGLVVGDYPWSPWYDKAFGFVVRAETEVEARQFAHDNAGDENSGMFLGKQTAATRQPWLDPKYSTCVKLTADGEPGVILRDFAAV